MDNNSLSDYFLSTVAYTTVIILSEMLTSFITDALISFDGYIIFRSDRVGTRGSGVCPYICDLVHENFTVTSLAVHTGGIDSLFLKVTNSSTTFALGCA